jgi:predicted SnoaL-like aldol condensation-catalyzing enzyme
MEVLVNDAGVDDATSVHSRPEPAIPDPSCPVVNDYLTAFYRGDFERARPLVTEDFSFDGPFVQVHGREEFFASAAALRPVVHGHRLVRQWRDGDHVCSIYDVDVRSPAGAGTVRMSEWHVLRDARLASATVLFDSARLRMLLPRP